MRAYYLVDDKENSITEPGVGYRVIFFLGGVWHLLYA